MDLLEAAYLGALFGSWLRGVRPIGVIRLQPGMADRS